MIGDLSQREIDEILRSQSLGRLGCHADGRTYVVPITYAYDGEFVYSHSLPGMKVQMMRTNPSVCFEVEDIEGMRTWRTVIAWGTYHELRGDAAADGIRLLVEQGTSYLANEIVPPVGDHHDAAAEPPVVFRVRLIERTGRFERP